MGLAKNRWAQDCSVGGPQDSRMAEVEAKRYQREPKPTAVQKAMWRFL